MKNINKIIISLVLIFFVLFGTYKNVSNLISPTIAQAVEFDIGQAAQDANIPGTADYDATDPEGGFGVLLGKILNIVVVIAALLVFMYLIWAGIEWITSAGDKGKLENARNKITQSIVGLIVLASVVALFIMIQSFLGLEVLTFSSI